MTQQPSLFDIQPNESSAFVSVLADRRQFIALDIEATGLNPEKEKVIEIAVVKFNDEKILDTYQTFVNPQKEIPKEVVLLTGIKDSDVAKAPLLSDLKDHLKNFIGDLPIVGHFIEFDINFLNFHGYDIKNKQLDTCELARIILPNEDSYNLEMLGHQFHIPHENAHRALDDTLACIELLKILREKLQTAPQQLWEQIKNILQKGNYSWKEEFLFINSKIKSMRTDAPLEHLCIAPLEHLCIAPLEHLCIAPKSSNPSPISQPLIQKLISFPYNTDDADPNNLLHAPSYYFDQNKFQKCLKKDTFSEIEIFFFLKLIFFQYQFETQNTDPNNIPSRSNLRLYNKEKHLWSKVCHNFESLSQTEFWAGKKNKAEISCSHNLIYEFLKEKNSDYIKAKELIINNPDAFIKYLFLNLIENLTLNKLESCDLEKNLHDKLTMLFGLLGIFYEENFANVKSEMILELQHFNTKKWQEITRLIQDITEHFTLTEKLTENFNKIIEINFEKYLYSITLTEQGDIILKIYSKNINNEIQKIKNSFEKTILQSNFPLTENENEYLKSILGNNAQCIYKNNIAKIDFEMIENIELIDFKNSQTDFFILTTSDANVKNIYNQLLKTIDFKDNLLLGQNQNGNMKKLQNTWKENEILNRILICKYEYFPQFINNENPSSVQTHCLPAEVSTKEGNTSLSLIIHKIPFDNLKSPIYKIWGEKFANSFINFSIPRTTLQIKNALFHFSKLNANKKILCADERVTKYNGIVMENLKGMIN